MRWVFLLGAMFALAATSGVGHLAAGIRLVDVRFSGDTRLEAVDLRKCAVDLKSRVYDGPEWLSNIAERVRFLCLQDNGYFKAAVKPSSEQLPDKHGTHQFVITFDIHAGPRYRTGEVAFRNNRRTGNGHTSVAPWIFRRRLSVFHREDDLAGNPVDRQVTFHCQFAITDDADALTAFRMAGIGGSGALSRCERRGKLGRKRIGDVTEY